MKPNIESGDINSLNRKIVPEILSIFRLLDKRDRRKIAILTLAQIVSNILDLVGVGLLGLLGALSVNGIQSKSPSGKLSNLLRSLGLQNFSFQTQVASIALLASLILIGRTIFSVILTRKSLSFLSSRAANLSNLFVRKFLNQDLQTIQESGKQKALFALTSGMSTIVLGVLGSSVAIISDGTLLVFLVVGLTFIDFVASVGLFLAFLIVASLLYTFTGKKMQKLSRLATNLTIFGNSQILETIEAYREITLRNRMESQAKKIGINRIEISSVMSTLTFQPNISKYVLETFVVLSSLGIAGFQFLTNDAAHAVAILTIFLAAGTRIAPAVLRVQQNFLQIRSNIGSAHDTLEMIDNLKEKSIPEENSTDMDFAHDNFTNSLEVVNVRFRYQGSLTDVLDGLSFKANPGEFIAIVGSSGSGKSTLMDLMLGVQNLESGEIRISGELPKVAISKWPGAIGYVPQNVAVSTGTILENLAIGMFPSEYNHDKCWHALRVAQLEEWVLSKPGQLNFRLETDGNSISGGQRQRLGIARAILTNPKIIFMDEATSALDAISESQITGSLKAMKGNITLVVVAHRLSTVVNADKVIYIDKGKIAAQGTFEEVRNKVSEFDKQAKLMGLN